jgi:cystathionine gamma-synthase
LWTITDIALTCDIAHAAGAMVAVDSTVATPVLTRPLALGADIVMHSATKYLNGHSDVIAGTLTTRADSDLWQRIKTIRAQLGGILGRSRLVAVARHAHGVSPRVQSASTSAAGIALHFAQHPLVRDVLYPGLLRSRATRSRRGRCTAVLAECCRSRAGIASRPWEARAIAPQPTSSYGSARLPLAAWKASSSIARASRARARRRRPICCGSPSGIEDTNDLIADLEQALERDAHA